jgi:hypothetical protein
MSLALEMKGQTAHVAALQPARIISIMHVYTSSITKIASAKFCPRAHLPWNSSTGISTGASAANAALILRPPTTCKKQHKNSKLTKDLQNKSANLRCPRG